MVSECGRFVQARPRFLCARSIQFDIDAIGARSYFSGGGRIARSTSSVRFLQLAQP